MDRCDGGCDGGCDSGCDGGWWMLDAECDVMDP